MDKTTIGKIITAAVGLGVIACGAWLGAQDAEHADTLILAGLAILGGLGTLALPRLGEPRTPRDEGADERARRRRTRSGTPPLPVLWALLALALTLTAHGCGGAPREAREALAVTAAAVDATDQVLRERIRRRAEEARAELLALATSGRVQTVEAGMTWYDAQLEPETTATQVLETAAASLRGVEEALDAWDAGAADGQQRWLETAACSVAAIASLAEALVRAGVEVPAAIQQWGPTVRAVVLVSCPEPTTGGA